MITVELTTPEKLVFSDQVDFIAVPAVNGELGILPHHAPLLAQMGPGELRFQKAGQTSFLAVSGGFLEVQKGSRVEIFAETAEMAGDIDVERARLAAERAKAQLESDKSIHGVDLSKIEADLRRAVVRLKVAETRGRLYRSSEMR